jgi:hypothetical protein
MDGTKALQKHSQSTALEPPNGSFWLFKSLGSALANSTEADRLDDFLQRQKKAPHQSADLKKTTWNTYFLGATE